MNVWEKHYSEDAKAFDPSELTSATLHEVIDEAADLHGPKPALTTILPTGAETTITYAELRDHANAFAVYLREVVGLKQGDCVALMTPNCIDFGVASFGIAKAGCVSTNVNPMYTAEELQHQLSDSNAQVLVIMDLFGDKIAPVVPKTNVKKVVTLSVIDFFPTLKKMLLGFVLKRVRKVLPDITAPHTPMAKALAEGRAAMGRVDVAAYTKDVSATDTAVFQYTSGTTGRSKGAELHHLGIVSNARQAELMTDSVRGPEGETTLIILPLYHITAFTLIFIAGVRQGGHGILVPNPRPPSNLKSAFENHKITWFTGINTLFAALLNEPWFDRKLFEHVRFCGSGGAAQQTGVAMKWEEATGIRINQGYGMTEISGVLTLNPPAANRYGTVGIPVPGAEVRLVDDAGNDVALGEPGEVIARSPALMKGYINRPDATAETIVDGWLHSGDIGVMDDDGFIEIVDRKKDMILVSGFNVSPNEIEDAISTIPGVVQVGVIGIPDEKTAEAPAAFIVRSSDDVTEDLVIKTCREKLTAYKTPRRVEFVDEVPVTLSGKVLRRELRDKYVA